MQKLLIGPSFTIFYPLLHFFRVHDLRDRQFDCITAVPGPAMFIPRKIDWYGIDILPPFGYLR